MTYDQFIESTQQPLPPEDLDDLVKALWLEKSGKWDEAHTIAQSVPTPIGSAVHAYLHRVEGDLGNAGYWYNRAARDRFSGSQAEEWESLVRECLSE